MKYSDMAQRKCSAGTSAASLKYIFLLDCMSRSTLINIPLHAVDLPVVVDTNQELWCGEKVTSLVASIRYWPFPHQGSSKCFITSSSDHILPCVVYGTKLFSCASGEDFQQSLGIIISQPSAPQNQPSLELKSCHHHSGTQGKRKACSKLSWKGLTPP